MSIDNYFIGRLDGRFDREFTTDDNSGRSGRRRCLKTITCMCKLTEGEVEYLQPPTAEIDPGSVLICISSPKTALAIDV